jgi:nicotinate-nucleotide adenylyltransferase
VSGGGAGAHAGARIGILGGSFNPAHLGHRHISLEALKRLGLDEIWWMVTPQNPLKPVEGMAPFEERLEGARRLARHPRIRVTDIEERLGTLYTADTLAALRRHFPRLRLVWIMGADNLIQIPKWEEWTRIFEAVPIAIFNRPTYSLRALNGKAAQRFRRFRLKPREARRLVRSAPPAWVFLVGPLHPASATLIRAARGRPGAAAVSAPRPEPLKTATGRALQGGRKRRQKKTEASP